MTSTPDTRYLALGPHASYIWENMKAVIGYDSHVSDIVRGISKLVSFQVNLNPMVMMLCIKDFRVTNWMIYCWAPSGIDSVYLLLVQLSWYNNVSCINSDKWFLLTIWHTSEHGALYSSSLKMLTELREMQFYNHFTNEESKAPNNLLTCLTVGAPSVCSPHALNLLSNAAVTVCGIQEAIPFCHTIVWEKTGSKENRT